MKIASSLALAAVTVLCDRSAAAASDPGSVKKTTASASLRGATTAATIATTAAAVSSAEGATAVVSVGEVEAQVLGLVTPPVVSEDSAGEEATISGRRMLQRPDEACYTNGPSNDDYFATKITATACTPSLLGACNNVPACAAYEQDAINFGSAFCSTWTVWNNEEPTCQWQYMCC
jgi:hypothetical protein